MSMSDSDVGPLLDAISAKFSGRHQQIGQLFKERFRQLREVVSLDQDLSEQRQLLIGAYFVSEFSVESAALFNPSMIGQDLFFAADTNVLTRRALNVPELKNLWLQVLLRAAAITGGAGGWLDQEAVRLYNQIHQAALDDPNKLYSDQRDVRSLLYYSPGITLAATGSTCGSRRGTFGRHLTQPTARIELAQPGLVRACST
jgi:hypothetical protein